MSAISPPSSPVSGPARRRWRSRLMLALFVLLALYGVYRYLTSPRRLIRLAVAALRENLGVNTTIATANFDFPVLTFAGVDLRLPDQPAGADRLFDAGTVRLRLSPWRLLRGQVRVQGAITIDQPRFYITEELGQDRFTFQNLVDRQRRRSGGTTFAYLPPVTMTNGQVVFGRVAQDRYQHSGIFSIEGQLINKFNRPGLYELALWRSGIEQPEHPLLQMDFDLRERKVSGRIENFTFTGAQRNLLPHRLQEWWDLFAPTGNVPIFSFSYDPQTDGDFHANFMVRDLAVTLPYGKKPTRAAIKSGHCEIAGETITVAGVTGEILGVPCTLEGKIIGLTRDAGLSVTITAAGLFPTTPEQLESIPPIVRRYLVRFQPRGRFNAKVKIERAPGSDQLICAGYGEPIDAQAKDQRWCYPLEHLGGRISFSSERIDLDLHGTGPTGAKIKVTGPIAPPHDDAEAHIMVAIDDLPVDQFLGDALHPVERGAVRDLTDQAAYARLVQTGLIRRPDLPSAQSQAALPVFSPGGKVHVVVHIDRPLGKNVTWSEVTHVDMAGLQALWGNWPYPLEILGGQLVIHGRQIQADNIQARGLHGGTFSLNGVIAPAPNDPEKLRPNFHITAQDVPVDNLLLASIPPVQAKWLQDLHLAGRLAAETFIATDAAGAPTFRLELRLADGRVQPYGGRIILEKTVGAITVSHTGVVIHSLQGDFGPSVWNLAGNINWGGVQPDINLTLHTTGTRFEDPLADLFPPQNAEFRRALANLTRYHVRGVFDSQITYRAPVAGSSEYQALIQPKSLACNFSGRGINLANVTGVIAVAPSGLTFQKFTGQLDSTRIGLDGQVIFGDFPAVNLTLAAQAEHLTPALLDALPSSLAQTLRDMQVNGQFDMRDARLSYHAEQKQDAYDFSGKITLANASAGLSVPVTQLNGELAVHAWRKSDAAYPQLELALQARTVRIADRLVSPLSVQLVTAPGNGRFQITQLQGNCYGGSLIGSGWITSGTQSWFSLQLSLCGAQLEPIVHPENDSPWRDRNTLVATASAPDNPTGILSANLSIEGSSADPKARRGRGELQIRDARLYELPVAMALLQIINLSWPSSHSFDSAWAAYLLDGDLVRLESIRFEAPSVLIAGSGTMSYASHALDLNLYTRNPTVPKLGPFSDALAMVKDELLSIQVTGTLNQPHTHLQTLSGIRRSWNEIFGAGRRTTPPSFPPTLSTSTSRSSS